MGDAVWQRIKLAVQHAGRMTVRVGVFASAGETPEGFSLTDLAAVHEFGNGHVPQRSFIRRALVWNSGPWLPAFVAKLVGQVVKGSLDEQKALEILGQRAVQAVRATITGEPIPPPLAPSTVARKGSSRPLVDTGRLLNGITYEVFTGSGAQTA